MYKRQIKSGGLVAFPTDTVYAVGAAMDNEAAIDKLFEVKQRPKDNPVSVLVARDLDIHLVIDITAPNNQFMSRFVEEFWPGPLTIVMPRILGRVPENITGGRLSVGVRQPDDPIARALIDEVGVPLAAPSANISGHPSPTTGQHVICLLYTSQVSRSSSTAAAVLKSSRKSSIWNKRFRPEFRFRSFYLWL